MQPLSICVENIPHPTPPSPSLLKPLSSHFLVLIEPRNLVPHVKPDLLDLCLPSTDGQRPPWIIPLSLTANGLGMLIGGARLNRRLFIGKQGHACEEICCYAAATISRAYMSQPPLIFAVSLAVYVWYLNRVMNPSGRQRGAALSYQAKVSPLFRNIFFSEVA